MNRKKICIIGAQGVGKTTICNGVIINLMQKLVNNYQLDGGISYSLESCCNNINKYYNLALIPEQFREVVKDIPNFKNQTEEITLTTYAKQLYLENLYTAQGKNILCDRSVLDTLVYYDYFNKQEFGDVCEGYFVADLNYSDSVLLVAKRHIEIYSKIYLIEPSDRPIEDDGFRLTDKKQQLEVHNLFLEYFRNFDNVEIVNQEDAHKEEFINKVVNEFVL